MDREWILNHLNFNNLEDSVYIITEYCKETERAEEDTKKLLDVVFVMPHLLTAAVKNIQQFYFKKYNICILRDQQNNIIKLF